MMCRMVLHHPIGQSTEGTPLRVAKAALARDPMSWLTSLVLAMVDLFDGQIGPALARLRESREKPDPEGALSGGWLAQASAYEGLEDEACAFFEQVAGMNAAVFSDTSRLFALALRNDRDGVVQWLESAESMRAIALTDEIYPLVNAASLARVGDHERTLE